MKTAERESKKSEVKAAKAASSTFILSSICTSAEPLVRPTVTAHYSPAETPKRAKPTKE